MIVLHELSSPSSDWTARQPHARGWPDDQAADTNPVPAKSGSPLVPWKYLTCRRTGTHPTSATRRRHLRVIYDVAASAWPRDRSSSCRARLWESLDGRNQGAGSLFVARRNGRSHPSGAAPVRRHSARHRHLVACGHQVVAQRRVQRRAVGPGARICHPGQRVSERRTDHVPGRLLQRATFSLSHLATGRQTTKARRGCTDRRLR
jgi:hypothetical protein